MMNDPRQMLVQEMMQSRIPRQPVQRQGLDTGLQNASNMYINMLMKNAAANKMPNNMQASAAERSLMGPSPQPQGIDAARNRLAAMYGLGGF